MFVKIVNNRTRASKVCEADKVNVVPDAGDQVIVDITLNGEQLAEVCQKGVHTVYLMNDNGKTLDTYRL